MSEFAIIRPYFYLEKFESTYLAVEDFIADFKFVISLTTRDKISSYT